MDRVMDLFCRLLLATYPTLDVPAVTNVSDLCMRPICDKRGVPRGSNYLAVPLNVSSISELHSMPGCVEKDLGQAIDLPADADRLKFLLNISDICTTPGCVKAAAHILQNLDESVDPCDDFFQFACGGWMKRHASERNSIAINKLKSYVAAQLRVLLQKKLTGNEPNYVRMVKVIYDTCMDLKSIEAKGSEPLKKVLKDLGGWPVVEGENWDPDSFNWMETHFKIRRMGYNPNILIDLSSLHILGISSDLTLGYPSLVVDNEYLMQGLNSSTTTAYFNLMVTLANKLGANESYSKVELLKALNFESMLGNLIETHYQRIGSRTPVKYTVKQLIEEVREGYSQLHDMEGYSAIFSFLVERVEDPGSEILRFF
ncbi:neprilysin-2-like [Stegodyphus dumicola]|uniref:neprilysin-2-like n=1 Tax=Stegodyphus dumicola TaxID=202533 RepID=UPI0015A84575|nr:neprilysin-2-like [Stegodyphus dumicola]